MGCWELLEALRRPKEPWKLLGLMALELLGLLG